jgi:hypothetical protein
MLLLAAIILTAAALAGAGVATRYQRTRPAAWMTGPALAHGLLGIAGLVLLVYGLSGPPRGVAMGAGAFGRVAAVLIALAVPVAGVAIWVRRRRSPAAPLVVGLHATLAIAGLALLATYLSYPA